MRVHLRTSSNAGHIQQKARSQSRVPLTHAEQAKASEPVRGVQPLLQLQRQYGNRYVQRVLALARKGQGEAEAAPDVEGGIQRARGGGQALDSGVCAQMEPTFGADFSDVRVHADTEADTFNRALNARAFTTGQDIFFRQGAYNPGSSSGRELLTHELTHVVQQNGDKVQRKLTIGQPGEPYEQDADRVAQAVIDQEQWGARQKVDEELTHRQIEAEDAWAQRRIGCHKQKVASAAHKPALGRLVHVTQGPVPALQRSDNGEEPIEQRKPYPVGGFYPMPRFQIGVKMFGGAGLTNRVREMVGAARDMAVQQGPTIQQLFEQLNALVESSGARIERVERREERRIMRTFRRHPELIGLHSDLREKEAKVKEKMELKVAATADYRRAIANLTGTVAGVERREAERTLGTILAEQAAIQAQIRELEGYVGTAIGLIQGGKKAIIPFLATQAFRLIIQDQFQPELDLLEAEITRLRAAIRAKRDLEMTSEVTEARENVTRKEALMRAADAAVEEAKRDYDGTYDEFVVRMANVGIRTPRRTLRAERDLLRMANVLTDLLNDYIAQPERPPLSEVPRLRQTIKSYADIARNYEEFTPIWFRYDHNVEQLAVLEDWLRDQQRIGRALLNVLRKGDFLEQVRAAKERLTTARMGAAERER